MRAYACGGLEGRLKSRHYPRKQFLYIRTKINNNEFLLISAADLPNSIRSFNHLTPSSRSRTRGVQGITDSGARELGVQCSAGRLMTGQISHRATSTDRSWGRSCDRRHVFYLQAADAADAAWKAQFDVSRRARCLSVALLMHGFVYGTTNVSFAWFCFVVFKPDVYSSHHWNEWHNFQSVISANVMLIN